MSKIKKFFFNIVRLFITVTGAIAVYLVIPIKKHFVNTTRKVFKTKGNLIICNHVEWMDPPLINIVVFGKKLKFLAAKEIFKNKTMTFGLKCLNAVPIDRNSLDLKPFTELIDFIKQGNTVVIFPEEHISTDGEMLPFKSGASMVAALTDCNVIPIYKVKSRPFRMTHFYIGKSYKFSDYYSMYSIVNIEQFTKVMETSVRELKPQEKSI